jgi:hypothetical protein
MTPLLSVYIRVFDQRQMARGSHHSITRHVRSHPRRHLSALVSVCRYALHHLGAEATGGTAAQRWMMFRIKRDDATCLAVMMMSVARGVATPDWIGHPSTPRIGTTVAANALKPATDWAGTSP